MDVAIKQLRDCPVTRGKGLKMFGKAGADAITVELEQLLYQKVTKGRRPKEMTQKQKKVALKYLMLLKEQGGERSRATDAPMDRSNACTNQRRRPAHQQLPLNPCSWRVSWTQWKTTILSCVISLARSCKRSGQAHSHQAGG
jgi:hypothetical protein